MKKSDRMLVVAPERWDEACFAVPAVRALVGAGISVGVLCGRGQAGFWKCLDRVEIQTVEDESPSGSWDAVLAWEYGLWAKRMAAAGVLRRIAPEGERKLMKWATHPLVARVNVLEHRVRHYLATVEEMGIETRQAGYFAAAGLVVKQVANSVMLCPDSDFGANHEWGMDRWVELGRRLEDDGQAALSVAVGRGGRGLGERLAEHLGAGVRACDVSDLAGSMMELAGHEKVVSADGSLPHVAGFAGATCVVLFGPNDPAWRRPLGRHHAIVHEHVECAPCLMAKCPLDLRCQERLAVERVAAVVAGGF